MSLMAGIIWHRRGRRKSTSPSDEPPAKIVTMAVVILRRAVRGVLLALLSLPVLQSVLGNLPLHWVYQPVGPVGPNTVYVPGAGFSGFYYHLGFLHGLDQNSSSSDDHDVYYCYSSGCLGLVLAPFNLHDIWEAAVTVQQLWLAGELSRYHIVERFLNSLDLREAPENVRILLTDKQNGVRIEQPTNVTDLVQRLVETTAIPLITTPWPANVQSAVIDGGFSRSLHPACAETVHVPTTFATTVHTFNLALDKETAWELYDQGLQDAAAKRRRSFSQVGKENGNGTTYSSNQPTSSRRSRSRSARVVEESHHATMLVSTLP